MSYRLTIIARADQSGLGYQTYDYYKFLKPSKIVVIDMSILNGTPTDYSKYPDATYIMGIPRDDQIGEILDDTDVLLTAETPYNLNLYRHARMRGIKTICVENPEFYDHIKYPEFELPDMIILPSIWLEDKIRNHAESKGTKVVQLHHPVDRSVFEFRLRSASSFIHFAGKPAMHDRNGTETYMQACPDGTIITQSDDLAHEIRRNYRHSTVYTNVSDNKQMYQYGNVFVLPRRYGGNCLPLNEALSSGMPVIMTDISPNNHLLPSEWLIPAHITETFAPRFDIDVYEANMQCLVEKLDWFKNCNIEEESKKADAIADTISWDTLLPKYNEAIESIL